MQDSTSSVAAASALQRSQTRTLNRIHKRLYKLALSANRPRRLSRCKELLAALEEDVVRDTPSSRLLKSHVALFGFAIAFLESATRHHPHSERMELFSVLQRVRALGVACTGRVRTEEEGVAQRLWFFHEYARLDTNALERELGRLYVMYAVRSHVEERARRLEDEGGAPVHLYSAETEDDLRHLETAFARTQRCVRSRRERELRNLPPREEFQTQHEQGPREKARSERLRSMSGNEEMEGKNEGLDKVVIDDSDIHSIHSEEGAEKDGTEEEEGNEESGSEDGSVSEDDEQIAFQDAQHTDRTRYETFIDDYAFAFMQSMFLCIMFVLTYNIIHDYAEDVVNSSLKETFKSFTFSSDNE